MAFNKFDPHSEASSRDDAGDASSASAHRRSQILKYGWWLSLVYTALGFVFIGYWILSA